MKLYSINCGYFKLDGGAMFGVVPKSIWSKLVPADQNNMCSWALRCLLIEDNDRLILVDTGMGNKQSEKFFGHYYLHGEDSMDKSLAAAGFHRNDVTDVFLTHLHFDHCGGAVEYDGDKLVPAFKNATYWSNKYHWQWATEPNQREKASFLEENILPIQESGQLKFVNPSGNSETGWRVRPPGLHLEDFLPDISVFIANGHTEAMMLPKIQYKGQTLVYMADLLPSFAHIPLPYVMGYDTRPLITMTEKELFLNEALDKDYILFFEHDAAKECCTLQKTEKGIRPKEFFKLSDI